MAFAHRKETYKATPFHHKESSNEMWKAHLKKRCLDKLQERKEVIKNQLETMKRNNSNSPISPSSFPTTSFENNLNFNNNNNSSFSPNFIGSSNLFGNNNDIDMTTSNTNNSLHSSQTIMEDSSSIEKNQSSIIFNNSNNVNNNNNFFVNISNVHSKQPNQVTQQQNPITQQTTQNNKNNDENFLVSELINQEWKQIQRIENFETNQQIKALSPFSTPTYPNWDAENFDIGIIQEVETEIWNELQEDGVYNLCYVLLFLWFILFFFFFCFRGSRVFTSFGKKFVGSGFSLVSSLYEKTINQTWTHFLLFLRMSN